MTELEKRFVEVFPDQAEPVSVPVKFEPIEEPKQELARFVEAAKLAKEVIQKAGFEIEIAGRKYITAQGWAVLGSMFGLTVRTREIKYEYDDQNRLRVTAFVDVLRHGKIVGGAAGTADYDEANYRKDPSWENRPRSHLVSLAQTRAARKALQLLLSHIVALAGYEIEAAAEEVAPTELQAGGRAIDIDALVEAIKAALKGQR